MTKTQPPLTTIEQPIAVPPEHIGRGTDGKKSNYLPHNATLPMANAFRGSA